jgi:general secretion pathway protein F
MLYEVRALSADNRMSTLVLEAQDEAAARLAAAERSLRALAVRPAPRGAGWRSRAAFPVVLFSQELLALLEAGLTIVESLESLSEKSSPGVSRDVAAALAQALQQGQRFSQALAAFPDHFPPLYVGIVQAAETTSDLPASLARYVEFETRIATVRAKAVSAAIYPAILLVVGGGVTLFLLGYVVPRFAGVYADAGREMSFLTAALLGWGQFVANHTGFILFMLGALALGAILGWRALREKFSMADVLARLPWVGPRARTYELSRLYMTVGLLLSGGIALVRALQMVEATVGAGTRAQLRAAAQRIASGETFSSAMQANNLAEPVALRLFRVGERAGNLGEMLMKAATFYDTEVTRLIDRFSRAAEPILMAAIGIVVGTIVVLLYIPIFELAGTLQ